MKCFTILLAVAVFLLCTAIVVECSKDPTNVIFGNVSAAIKVQNGGRHPPCRRLRCRRLHEKYFNKLPGCAMRHCHLSGTSRGAEHLKAIYEIKLKYAGTPIDKLWLCDWHANPPCEKLHNIDPSCLPKIPVQASLGQEETTCLQNIASTQRKPRVSAIRCAFCISKSLTAINIESCSIPVEAPITGVCSILHHCKLLIADAAMKLPPDTDKLFCCQYCAANMEYDLDLKRLEPRFSIRRVWRNIKAVMMPHFRHFAKKSSQHDRVSMCLSESSVDRPPTSLGGGRTPSPKKKRLNNFKKPTHSNIPLEDVFKPEKQRQYVRRQFDHYNWRDKSVIEMELQLVAMEKLLGTKDGNTRYNKITQKRLIDRINIRKRRDMETTTQRKHRRAKMCHFSKKAYQANPAPKRASARQHSKETYQADPAPKRANARQHSMETYQVDPVPKRAAARRVYEADPAPKRASARQHSKETYQADPAPKRASARQHSMETYQVDPVPKRAAARRVYEADPAPKRASARQHSKETYQADPAPKRASARQHSMEKYQVDPVPKRAAARRVYEADPAPKRASARQHSKETYQADPAPKRASARQHSKETYQADPEPKRAAARRVYEVDPAPKQASARQYYYNNTNAILARRREKYDRTKAITSISRKLVRRSKQTLLTHLHSAANSTRAASALNAYAAALPIIGGKNIPRVARDSVQFNEMLQMNWYQQTRDRFVASSRRIEALRVVAQERSTPENHKLNVDHNLQLLLAVKREAQQLLNNQMHSISAKVSEASTLLAENKKGNCNRLLASFYGGNKHHTKSQESPQFDTSRLSYVLKDEMFPPPKTGSQTKDAEMEATLRDAVVTDLCTSMRDRVAAERGEELYPDKNLISVGAMTFVSRCCDTCDSEIPENWALLLHNRLKEIDPDNQTYAEMHQTVKSLETCAGCERSPYNQCDSGVDCTDMFLRLRKLAPHFSEVRNILRKLYMIRELNIYLAETDNCINSGNNNLLCKLVQPGAAEVPQGVATLLEREETDENFVERSHLHSDEHVMDVWGDALADVQHHMDGFPQHLCALCDRYRLRNQMKQKPFKSFQALEDAIGEQRRSVKKKKKKKVEHGDQTFDNDDHYPIVDELREKGIDFSKTNLFLCTECWTSVRNDKIPTFSRMNKIGVDDIPPEIAGMNAFELMLIQKVRPLMTVIKLRPLGGAFVSAATMASAVKGTAIHMPMPMAENLEYVLNELPSLKHLAIILQQIPTKQKIVWQSFVDVDKVLNALKWLVNNNDLYQKTDILTRDKLSAQLGEMVIETDGLPPEPEDKDIPAAQEAPSVEHVDKNLPMDHVTVQHMQKDVPDKLKFFDLFNCTTVTGDIVNSRHALLEPLSYPHLFPRGRFTAAAHRPVSVRSDAYLRYLLSNKDSRWRRNEMFLFDTYHKWVDRSVDGNIFTMRNSGSFRNVTAGQLKKDAHACDEQLYIHAAQVTAATKGYPEFWARKKGDLHALDAQYGPATFFVTWSWKDYALECVRKELKFMNSDIECVSTLTNSSLIKIDPVTNQKCFNRHLEAMLNLLKPKDGTAGPLGTVEHYFYRLEYQARGAPHVHMKLWIKNAPVYGESTDDEILDFLKDKITCNLPDKLHSPDLYRLVTQNQVHRCSAKSCHKTCAKDKRNRRRCRFGYPRKPNKTAHLIALEEVIKSRAKGRNIRKLYNPQRRVCETNVNDYNPVLLKAVGGNMDVQYVGEKSQALNRYISNYVAKGEKGQVQQMFDQLDENRSIHSRLKSLAINISHDRQVSIQEAIAIIIGTPLTGSDSTIEYLVIGMPGERSRKLKDKEQMDRLDEDSTDIYCDNLVDVNYPNRPAQLSGFSLHEVASGFTIATTKPANPHNDYYAFTIRGVEKYFRKRKPVVIKTRFCRTNTAEGRERQFHDLLMLHVPWRNEDELLGDCKSYSEAFIAHHDHLQQLTSSYHRQRQLAESLEMAKQWLTDAEKDDEDKAQQIEEIPTPMERVLQKRAELMTDSDIQPQSLQERLSSLQNNPQQWRVYKDVESTLQHQQEHLTGSCKCTKPSLPIRLHVAGKAGTGKSYLINQLVAMVNEKYLNKDDPYPTVAVCAPTGLAAFNINGVTLHKMFDFKVQHGQTGEGFFDKWDDTKTKIMRTVLKDVRLLIIDEISMVSSNILAKVHHRLQSLLPQNSTDLHDKQRLMGGLNVILLGDLLQLPPVNAPYPFQKANQQNVSHVPGLWSHFDYVELTQIMRQKDDIEFAEMLNRIRLGNLTEDDVDKLQSKVIDHNDTTTNRLCDIFDRQRQRDPTSAVCLFPTHEKVDQFNKAMLRHDKIECHMIQCEDQKHGIMNKKMKPKKRKSTKKSAKEKKTSDTGGLPTCLELGIGARVMLRRNLDTQTGLVNGALGYVTQLNFCGPNVKSIFVQFDNIAEVQNIEKFSADYELAPSVFVTRVQFPLVLAYAMTIHKSQGLTLNSVMVDLGGTFATNGMAYVALSRVTKFSGLHLIRFNIRKVRADKKCVLEYNRLRQTDPVGNLPPIDRFNCLPERFRAKEISSTKKRRMTVKVQLPEPDEPAVGVSPKKVQRKTETAKKTSSSKRVRFNTQPTSTRVALRLTNTLAESCYANALIQALLRASALGQRWDNRRSTGDDDVNVRHAWVDLVDAFTDDTTLESNTDALREAVAATYARRTGQQSLHNFFYDFVKKLPSWVPLISMQHTIYMVCDGCRHKTSPTSQPCISYSIGREEAQSAKVSFEGQFIQALTSQVQRRCQSCGSDSSQRIEKLELTPTTKYVTVFVATQTQTQPRRVLHGSIVDFVPDDVHIPGIAQAFRTVAAVVHEGVDEKSGHFYTYTSHNGRWLLLDCLKSSVDNVARLPLGLKGVMMLLLEKK